MKLYQKDAFNTDFEIDFAIHNSTSLMTQIHNHDFMEIFIVNEGKVIHSVNNNSEELEKGRIVFIRQEDFHKYISLNESYSLINLAFSVNLFNSIIETLKIENMKEIFLDPIQPPNKKLNIDTQNVLIKKLTQASELRFSNFKRILPLLIRT